MTSWSATEAKAKFSEVITKAMEEGPQEIVRRGETVMLVSKQAWEKRSKPRRTVAEFFQKSPLRGSGIDLTRDKSGERELDL